MHKGVNAIDRLRAALDRLKDLENAARRGAASRHRAIAAAPSPISEALSGAGEAATLQRVTVNIGTIDGGISPNLVPTHAIALADIRLPGRHHDRPRSQPSSTMAQPARRGDVAARCDASSRPSRRPKPRDRRPRTRRVAAEVLGKAPAVNMRVGGSDSRWYRMHSVPTVVYGLTPFNMGGPDEHVLVDELVAVAKIHTLVGLRLPLRGANRPWTACPMTELFTSPHDLHGRALRPAGSGQQGGHPGHPLRLRHQHAYRRARRPRLGAPAVGR